MAIITYHNPVKGFTKGTKQGLAVCGVLLAVLLGFTAFGEVVPGTPLARTLDLLFGLCLAVAAVWVVGGTFEIEGKYYDFGVKVTGGAALLFVTLFWLQPISHAQASATWRKVVELPSDASLVFVIDQVADERRRGQTESLLSKLAGTDG